MSIISGFRASASALAAQRLRMDVVANNIANAQTTRGVDGGPFRRQQVVFRANAPGGGARIGGLLPIAAGQSPIDPLAAPGVSVAAIVADETPGQRAYDPSHPDAGPDGFVMMPNVDMSTEMVDLMAAGRAYEANITALNAMKSMAMRAIEIGRG